MLGYVFWHWPRRGTSSRAYERDLAEFHRSLCSHPPEGMEGSLSFRIRRRPWSRARGVAYEDWYLVEDYRALGALNAGAVATSNLAAHNRVAEGALGGTGGLYALKSGELELRKARFATWATKPPRTTYQGFFGRLSELTDDLETDIWQRQMVMGPAPEFCVHSGEPLKLPKAIKTTVVPLELVAGREP